MRPGPRQRAAPPPPAHPEGCACASHSRRKQQSLEAEEAKRRLKEQSIFVSHFPGLSCLARKVKGGVHVFWGPLGTSVTLQQCQYWIFWECTWTSMS